MSQLSKSTTAHSLALVVAVMVAAPISSSAQDTGGVAYPWRVASVLGAWLQDYETGTRRHVGPFVSLHVSRQVGVVVRLTASVAYHRLEDAREITLYDATGGSRTDVYDRDFISATAGVAADLWQGRAAGITVGFEAGPGWSRGRYDRSSGSLSGPFNQPPSPGWGPATFVGFGAPSVAVRYAVATRTELTAMGRLLMGIGDIHPAGIPVLGAGVAYRF
jgi:hypothetical protein